MSTNKQNTIMISPQTNNSQPKKKLRERTFLPAILLERLPIQRGEKVHNFLTWRTLLLSMHLFSYKNNEVYVDIVDKDDNFLLSKQFPES